MYENRPIRISAEHAVHCNGNIYGYDTCTGYYGSAGKHLYGRKMVAKAHVELSLLYQLLCPWITNSFK